MISVFQIDAFADRPFAGNPAAVCLLDAPRETEWMQRVAAEMNLSETAFVEERAEGDGFNLRWFTPAIEVNLCGHATLASAEALWRSGRLAPTAIARFLTRSGWLTAERKEDEQKKPWIELDFPARQATECAPPPGLLEALGARALWVGRSRDDYLVEVASEDEVRSLAPDFVRLRTVETRGTTVTTRGTNGRHDFVSRFFAPAAGIDEDPVTGSAHCTLTPFWAARLGRSEMVGFQASRRGGEVRVRLEGDRVRLGGRAITVLEGHLLA